MIRAHVVLFGKNMFAQSAAKDKECSAQNKFFQIFLIKLSYRFNHNK